MNTTGPSIGKSSLGERGAPVDGQAAGRSSPR
jgi:hypothetical protein